MTTPEGTVRVFVALDLPAPAKETLRATIGALEPELGPGVRWVDPAGIHLTLKFLGNIDAGAVADLLRAMESAAGEFERPSFKLNLAELGVFPNPREPRVLWAGVAGDLAALERLQELVDEAISDLGFARERRPFRPHLTIGRVRDQVLTEERRKIGQVIQRTTLTSTDSWEVYEIHLIRSTLTPRGAIYDSIGMSSLNPQI